MNEYFLWLNNNDIVELEPFLKWYGDCLAERLCYYDDIFFYEHDDAPYNKVNSGIIQDSTRNLVEQLLRPAIAKKRRELNMSVQAQSTSIFNTHTRENIRPNDGTYYIDDFC